MAEVLGVELTAETIAAQLGITDPDLAPASAGARLDALELRLITARFLSALHSEMPHPHNWLRGCCCSSAVPLCACVLRCGSRPPALTWSRRERSASRAWVSERASRPLLGITTRVPPLPRAERTRANLKQRSAGTRLGGTRP
jgi:hypothetical protein